MGKEIPPFSFSAGERKIMAHFVVEYSASPISIEVDTSIVRLETSPAVFGMLTSALFSTLQGERLLFGLRQRDLFHLLQGRQMTEVFEIEELQELRRGAVEKRPARNIFARHGADQVALQQRADDAVDIDAANRFDLRAGNRLAVGDDRQGFERRPAHSGRPAA